MSEAASKGIDWVLALTVSGIILWPRFLDRIKQAKEETQDSKSIVLSLILDLHSHEQIVSYLH